VFVLLTSDLVVFFCSFWLILFTLGYESVFVTESSECTITLVFSDYFTVTTDIL